MKWIKRIRHWIWRHWLTALLYLHATGRIKWDVSEDTFTACVGVIILVNIYWLRKDITKTIEACLKKEYEGVEVKWDEETETWKEVE